MAVLKRTAYQRKGTKAQTDAGTIAARSLAQQCLRLRADGLTFPQIVDRLDPTGQSTLSVKRVRELVMAEMDRQGLPTAEELRAEMIVQADRLFNRAVQIAMKDGNRDRVPALAAAMKVQERIAALMGLDAPRQTEVKDTTDREVAPATAEDIVAQLAEEARADLAKQGLDYDPSTGAVRPVEG